MYPDIFTVLGLMRLLSGDIYEVKIIKDFNGKKYLIKWKRYSNNKNI